jgi:hypothetical protein
MADYDAVTVDMFTTRFPIFADNDPAQLAAVLAEASARVGRSWLARDYPVAIMYLTAHLLTLDASQEGDEVSVGPAGAGKIIASESIAGMSTSYFNPNPGVSQGGSVSEYAITEYGRRYLKLRKLNFTGPSVV